MDKISFNQRMDRSNLIIEKMLQITEKDTWRQGFIHGAVFQMNRDMILDSEFLKYLEELYSFGIRRNAARKGLLK